MRLLLISVLAVAMIGVMVPSAFACEMGIDCQLFIQFDEIHLPDWLRVTAGWWGNEKISNGEFLHTIEFLGNNNFMPYEFDKSSTDYVKILSEPLNYSTKRVLHDTIDDAITNPFPRIEAPTRFDVEVFVAMKNDITTKVMFPDGNIEEKITKDAQGLITTKAMNLKSNSPSGLYNVLVLTEKNGLIKNQFLFVGSPPIHREIGWIDEKHQGWINQEEVLGWVKHNAKLWSESQIPDTTFQQTIQYLIQMEIVQIDSIPIIVTKTFDKDRLGGDGKLGFMAQKWNSLKNDYQQQQKSNDISYTYQGKTYYYTPESDTVSKQFTKPSISERYDYSYDYNYDMDADVRWLNDRTNYYANQWISDLESYAQKMNSGDITYEEYETLGMQSFDYYGDMLNSDFDYYWNSKYPYP